MRVENMRRSFDRSPQHTVIMDSNYRTLVCHFGIDFPWHVGAVVELVDPDVLAAVTEVRVRLADGEAGLYVFIDVPEIWWAARIREAGVNTMSELQAWLEEYEDRLCADGDQY